MSKNFSTPQEITEAVIAAGIKRAGLPALKMILLGIFAGLFIGFGANGSIAIMQTFGKIDAGFAKFLGAAVFPVGLMLVIVAGSELFTGNCLMTLPLFNKKILMRHMLKNWVLVYIGNFIGSVVLAWAVANSGLFGQIGQLTPAGELAVKLASTKVSLGFGEAFIRAIFCNMLVVLAVWLATGSQDVISKIFSAWFPIMLFVLSGFEHSIANMYFIPAGLFMGAGMTWADVWVKNLIPVTLGNILGGAIIVPAVYHYCYSWVSSKKAAAADQNTAAVSDSAVTISK